MDWKPCKIFEKSLVMEKTERNSNIELLRIILMIMVVTLHFNNGDMGGAFNLVGESTINSFILYFLESISICAVNCFMIISGYFLAYNHKVKLSKIVDLYTIVTLYSLLDYITCCIVTSDQFSISRFILRFIPANYFAIFYIVTYIFSPFIVKIFDSTNKKQQNILLISVLTILTVYPFFIDILQNLSNRDFSSLSTITLNGSCAGYTIVQFFTDLIIGIYLARHQINVKTKILLPIFFTSSILMTILAKKIPSVYNYDSFFTIINAVCLFLIFNNFSLKNKPINFISKSMFAVYCIHTSFIPMTLWRHIITQDNIGQGIGKMIFWTLICIATMFLACLILDFLFRGIFYKIKNSILGRLPVILDLDSKKQ